MYNLGSIHTADQIKQNQKCHGFTQTDGFVRAAGSAMAWHGLGRELPRPDMTANDVWTEAFPWEVELSDTLTGTFNTDSGNPDRASTDGWRMLRRSDTREVFTVVSDGYAEFQNSAGCELAEALARNSGGRAIVETAGSLKGGRRCWLLLKGEAFEPRAKDTVVPYFMLAWSHDQSLAVVGIPTAVRVVCKNTQEMAVAGAKRGRMISLRHSGSMEAKISAAKQAMDQWAGIVGEYQTYAAALAARPISDADRARFYEQILTAVVRDGTPIPFSPTNAKERADRDECAQIIARWNANYRVELDLAGNTVWNAANAITRWFDHQKTYRGADDAARREARVNSALFGTGRDGKNAVFTAARALLPA